MATASDPSFRWSCYHLLIAATVAIAAAKVVGAELLYEPSRYSAPTADGYSKMPPDPPRNWPFQRPEPTPIYSSNDRSRWATVRALVDEGTYVIGKRENFDRKTGYTDTGIIFEDQYRSLDKVMDPETGLFYSSKPPLYPTMLAGGYLLLKKFLGWDIVGDRWYVICTLLMVFNVLPFGVYLFLLARIVEERGGTDFGRLLTFVTAAFGTFLMTFVPTVNNHLPGAFCVLFAVYPLLRKATSETTGGLIVAGFMAGLACTFEFPAAAFLAGLFALITATSPKRAVLIFLPAALVPVLALVLANQMAMGRVLPAYTEFGGPWYNYPGSYWAKAGTDAAKGIDFANETKDVYAFHLLFGHHGWFSLTPVWALALGGLVGGSWKAVPELATTFARFGKGTLESRMKFLPLIILAVSTVVIGFYIYKTNNYGGFTSGPRWLFWLTPLWLLGLLPAADWLGRTTAGRWVAIVLMGISVFSVFYPSANPWRPPWVLQLLETEDWLRYD